MELDDHLLRHHCLGTEDVAVFRANLEKWFRANKRTLPWRTLAEQAPHRLPADQQPVNPDETANNIGYAVWVSEIMLQQTQVQRVIAYYTKWMRLWPTVADLARADPESLREAWQGLGYYSRAQNLQKGCQVVMERFGGSIPRTLDGLQSLPGIGPYSAGAIGSVAFGLPAPLLDGNVMRVLTRVWAIGADTKQTATNKLLWALSEALLTGWEGSTCLRALVVHDPAHRPAPRAKRRRATATATSAAAPSSSPSSPPSAASVFPASAARKSVPSPVGQGVASGASVVGVTTSDNGQVMVDPAAESSPAAGVAAGETDGQGGSDAVAQAPVQAQTQGQAEVQSIDPGAFNQALMELGALVCSPKTPQCTTCPVRAQCRAYLHATQRGSSTGMNSASHSKPTSSPTPTTSMSSTAVPVTTSDRYEDCWVCGPPFDELGSGEVGAKAGKGAKAGHADAAQPAAAKAGQGGRRAKQSTLSFGATRSSPATKSASAISAPSPLPLSRESVAMITRYPRAGARASVRQEHLTVVVLEFRPDATARTPLYCVVRRPPTGLLANMWEFVCVPRSKQADGDGGAVQARVQQILKVKPPPGQPHGHANEERRAQTGRRVLGEFVHQYSHIHQRLSPEIWVLGPGPDPAQASTPASDGGDDDDDDHNDGDALTADRIDWVSADRFSTIAMGNAMKKVWGLCESEGEGEGEGEGEQRKAADRGSGRQTGKRKAGRDVGEHSGGQTAMSVFFTRK